jgi:hypothetical protein
MHAAIEAILNGAAVSPTGMDKELVQFRQFFAEFRYCGQPLQPYRTEWSIYTEAADVAGQVDALFTVTVDGRKKFVLVDWKRVDPSPRRRGEAMHLLGKTMPCFRNATGFGLLGNHLDTSYSHYCLQQALYAWMLKEGYSIEVDAMFLVQLHPEMPHGDYHVVEVPREMMIFADAIMRDRILLRRCCLLGCGVHSTR